MKARVNPINLMSERQRNFLQQRVEELAAESVRSDEIRIIGRWYKLLMLALNREYGFGADRLARVCKAINDVAEEERRDPEFWHHADVRLKQLGMDVPESVGTRQ